MGNPDKKSVTKIYEIYMKDLEGADQLDYTTLAENTPDCPGAVIAGIAKRAHKLCKKRNTCNNELVQAAADSMKHHLKLMKEEVEEVSNGSMNITLTGAKMTVKELNGETASHEKAVKAN